MYTAEICVAEFLLCCLSVAGQSRKGWLSQKKTGDPKLTERSWGEYRVKSIKVLLPESDS